MDGKQGRITLEEYRERITQRLVAEVGNILDFPAIRIKPPDGRPLIDGIVRGGFSPRALQVAEEPDECDLYNVLGEVGHGLNRLRRADRASAFTYKHHPWLDAMHPTSSTTARAIASRFARVKDHR